MVAPTKDEPAGVLAANPFPGEPNPKLVHVVFMKHRTAEPPAGTHRGRGGRGGGQGQQGHRPGRRPCAFPAHAWDGYGKSDLAESVFKIIATLEKHLGLATTKLLSLRLEEKK